MRILAIETSCDETAAAIVHRANSVNFVTVESSIVASQSDLHAKYGGVYPEVASREHVRQILPVISEALRLDPIGGRLQAPDFSNIDRLAVTIGPGLIGSLLVGVQAVASIGLTASLPIIGVNHLAGHIYASFIQNEAEQTTPQFPLMALVVSGGHTLLVIMKEHFDFSIIGETLDDAAGEAFDKTARLLGLGYPGGPAISRLATHGDRHAFDFPISLEHDKSYNFSFSGLKTAVLRQVQKQTPPLDEKTKADLAASFERTVVESLLAKVNGALKSFAVRSFVLGGGVAANVYLRERLETLLAYHVPQINFFVPPSELCTDNAAVIGAAAAFSPQKVISPDELQAYSRLPLHSPSP